MRPPGFTIALARSSTSAWSFSRTSSAPGRIRHLASGLRRQVPVPLQGASISTRSADALMSASGSASPFGARTSALCTPARDSRSWIGASWRLSRSVAISRPLPPIIAASASVLPPAPAQRSITCSPGFAAEQQRGELRALVLHLDGALDENPLPHGCRDCARRRRARCASRSATTASAWRRDASARPSHLLALGLQRVDAQIERRAARHGGRLRHAIFAEHGRKMRIEPFRIIAGDMAPARRRASARSARRARPRRAAPAQSGRRRTAPRSPRHPCRARA